MNGGWHYVASNLVIGFLFRCKAKDRQRLLSLLDRLIENPYVTPQTISRDDTGRELSWLRVAGFEVVFWLDHFLREVRVVEVIKIRN